MKRESNFAANAWIALGGLLALGTAILMIRELPAMRRELRIMRM
jgi:hypothetical protein